MVLLDIELHDFPMFPLAYGFEYSPQFLLYFLGTEDFTSVLRGPDQVVF
jgi:hypothetical protein